MIIQYTNNTNPNTTNHTSTNTNNNNNNNNNNNIATSRKQQSGLMTPLTHCRSCWTPTPSLAASRLRTNGVNTNGATAKVMILTDLGKRYALAFLGIYK